MEVVIESPWQLLSVCEFQRFLKCCRFSLAQDGPYLMRDRVGYDQTNMLLPIGLVRQFLVRAGPYLTFSGLTFSVWQAQRYYNAIIP